MRYTLLIFAVLLSSASFSQRCEDEYFAGWYCDYDGVPVYCSASYYGLYESAHIDCPYNSFGCSFGSCICSAFACAHGTTNRDCSCTCSYPWAGYRCDICTRSNYECGNGGYINSQTCQCNCPNTCLNGGTQGANCACSCKAPWSGQRCETCTRSSSECANGGYMDPATCKCQCPNRCLNGGVQNENCGCTCPSPWTGPKCETCSLAQANCENGSTLNSNTCQCTCAKGCEHSGTLTRTCDCNCPYPYIGKFCETCSFSASHCSNNSTFNGAACACDCSGADNCKNGGKRMADYSCGCDCVSGWQGNDCTTCGRDASYCLRGGAFQAGKCNCDCTGTACKNGKPNERCQCVCNSGYKGEDCSVASAGWMLKPSVFLIALVAAGVPLFFF